jgi:hypothetical protein
MAQSFELGYGLRQSAGGRLRRQMRRMCRTRLLHRIYRYQTTYGKAAEGRLRRQSRRTCRSAVAWTSSTYKTGFHLLSAQPLTAKPSEAAFGGNHGGRADRPFGHDKPFLTRFAARRHLPLSPHSATNTTDMRGIGRVNQVVRDISDMISRGRVLTAVHPP